MTEGDTASHGATTATSTCDYAEALNAYLATRDEASLAIGHELGRRALRDRMSVLDIIENHARLVEGRDTPPTPPPHLQFLLQTLAALDVATRGFLDGTRRYEQQRARAEDLADRDEFRSALVNSLQEGFFVADHTGTIVEINDAFADITGYGADRSSRTARRIRGCVDHRRRTPGCRRSRGTATSRSRREIGTATDVVDGLRWPSTRSRRGPRTATTYVGTIRDITAARAAAERERAVARLATAVSVAKSVDEVLSITLDQCRSTLDAQRLIAVMWPPGEGDPAIHVAGGPRGVELAMTSNRTGAAPSTTPATGCR